MDMYGCGGKKNLKTVFKDRKVWRSLMYYDDLNYI